MWGGKGGGAGGHLSKGRHKVVVHQRGVQTPADGVLGDHFISPEEGWKAGGWNPVSLRESWRGAWRGCRARAQGSSGPELSINCTLPV